MKAFDKEWQDKVVEAIENIKILKSKFDWDWGLSVEDKQKLRFWEQELYNLLFGYIKGEL